MKKDLISIKDLAIEEVQQIFELAQKIKAGIEDEEKSLSGKSLGLIFQKPSNRTRVSFEVGMAQLGGHTVYLGPEDIKLGQREKTSDIARTLSRYLDAMVVRAFSHNDILELAENSQIPVINGLSDLLHPCQVLADLFTIKEKKGGLKGVRLAYVGDGNNILHSLLYGASKVGMDLSIATPKGYGPKYEILDEALRKSLETKGKIVLGDDPALAVKDADIIYTDVWVSMGQEAQTKKRNEDFRGFQVDQALVARAKPDCLIMHCLPAHRGEEITDEVMDGPNSIVFDQAENRLHVHKAILLMLLS